MIGSNGWTPDESGTSEIEREALSCKSESACSVSVSELEKFIYETRDDSESFETEQDQLVAFGINQAMDGLKRLIAEKKQNDMVTFRTKEME